METKKVQKKVIIKVSILIAFIISAIVLVRYTSPTNDGCGDSCY